MMHSLPTEGADAPFPNATCFYRNEPLLRTLLVICESLLSKHQPIRVHVFAESTGEETWSLLFELIRRGIDSDVLLEASDADATCVSLARTAKYGSSAVSSIPSDVRERFLIRSGESYRVSHAVRRRVRHSRKDVRVDAGQPGLLDLALFQNVLVHMPEADQLASLRNLRTAQATGGFLSLGGVPVAHLRPVLEDLGYRPFEMRVRQIHESWRTQRRAWLWMERPYWALPPFQSEQAVEFCSIYQLSTD